ncbi:GTPase Era, mitochondrial [Halotydeus destructor]|nr:GTPase Era, mitochondrial [Halotydeus destructor]
MLRTIILRSVSLLSTEHTSYCVLRKLVRSESTLIGEQSSLFYGNEHDNIAKVIKCRNGPDIDSQDAKVLYNEDDERDVKHNQGSNVSRELPRTYEEFAERRRLPVIQPENPRLLKVAVIGMPNAGKSTLTNQLIGTKVSAVSSKVHTTRCNITGVLVEDETQIEFWDTPGLVTTKHCMKFSLEHTFMSGPKLSASRADLIMVVVDASNKRERAKINAGIMGILERHAEKKSILVLNKVDQIKKKKKLIDITARLSDGTVGGLRTHEGLARLCVTEKTHMQNIIDKAEARAKKKGYLIDVQGDSAHQVSAELDSENNLQDGDKDAVDEKLGWPSFSQVFMVSALDGDGIQDLRTFLIDHSPLATWRYNGSIVTPRSPQSLVVECIKEKVLENTRDEIPYLVKYHIESWIITAVGTLCVAVNLIVPQNRHMTFVLGPEGRTISAIAEQARQTMANAFQCDVALKLIVKSSEKKKRKSHVRK